jgi:hypothetical protein
MQKLFQPRSPIRQKPLHIPVGGPASAFLYRHPEDVRVVAVIIAKLKFRNIEVQILFANFVERPDHAALDERLETLNRVRVNRADHILSGVVIDRFMREGLAEPHVAFPLVRAEQSDFVRDGFVDECGQSGGFRVLDGASDHVAIALHGADDNGFAFNCAARPDAIAALVLVPIFSLSADESFFHFDNAAEFEVHHGYRRKLA